MSELFEKLGRRFAQQEQRRRSAQRNQLALWIGRIVIAFNELEARLAKEVAAELGHETVSVQDMLQASMSFGQKLDIFSALLVERHRNDSAHLDYINSVLSALSAAEDCRNAVVHSAWTTHPVFSTGFERRKAKTRGRKGLKVDIGAVNIAGLREAVGDIRALGSIATSVARHPKTAARYNQEAFKRATDRLRAACQPPPHANGRSNRNLVALLVDPIFGG